ncbi:MAG: hypothetical protein FJ146_10565 [Deltaproteobacteria bacterium]|nr:hypothetical protein [Deltaproteobacteria bacterium]
MKQLFKIFGILCGLATATLLLVRLALGLVVSTESFRNFFNNQTERALRSLLPTLMSEVGSVSMEGIASLLVSDLTVRNTRKISAALPLKRLLITLDLPSTVTADSAHLEIETMFGDYGRINLHASAPKWLLKSSAGDRDLNGALRIDGSATDLDAVVITNLLLADDAAPGFYLSRGLLSGTVQYSKPLGATPGTRTGRFLGQLKDAVWILAEDNNRPLLINKTPLNLDLTGHEILIRSPITLDGTSGNGSVTGSMQLPRGSDEDMIWNLEVQVHEDKGLSGSLVKLFKCKSNPGTTPFLVKGPISGSSCTPIPGDQTTP